MSGKTVNPSRRNKRWPGLTCDAETLGVSYGHLRLCVIGQRRSDLLMSRYRALKAKEGATFETNPKVDRTGGQPPRSPLARMAAVSTRLGQGKFIKP